MPLECTKCKTVRPLAEFYKKKNSASGYNPWCKSCYREWHRARYATKNDTDDAPRPCRKCGTVYTPKQRRASAYCSHRCKDRARNEQVALATQESKPDRECEGGGNEPANLRLVHLVCNLRRRNLGGGEQLAAF